MDTGAIRPYVPITHDPSPRRDDVAGSPTVTDLPVEKTVRAAQAASGGKAADDRPSRQEQSHPAIKTGFERDPSSGAIVYRWTDEVIDRVILEIPRSEKIRSQQAYHDQAATEIADRSFDRSV